MDKTRCAWSTKDTLYIDYHDNEWGTPVYDDDKLFEFLILETFQAGLSWITVLRKRENFRKAFDNFDYKKIADYKQDKVDALLQDAGIIRNKLKVNATINNAQFFILFISYFNKIIKVAAHFARRYGCGSNFKTFYFRCFFRQHAGLNIMGYL